MTRTPDFCRWSVPPICIKQELSAAQSTSAPVFMTFPTLSAHMAAEISRFLIANVPPNPQHSSAPGNATNSNPRTPSNNRRGRSPKCNPRNE
ncbi:hypothetical protein Amac_106780 [Acrocarpospora macrocephala]|uniref:Uncharacterized protein n=1 Tax=Acrocarpospora macrocephala TaxID=150177 RepID=A0A5M3X7L5_9ACTN|nr:hypothetical protein Amac_106780 [Acrocarpospora macrocephala]